MTEREWWRGNGEQQRSQLRDAIVEDSEKEDQSVLFDKMAIGVAAFKLMRGTANNREVVKVLAQMSADCEIKIASCTQQLLEMPDVTTPEAKHLHFIARVHAGIIGMLNQYVRDGSNAERAFNETTSRNRSES